MLIVLDKISVIVWLCLLGIVLSGSLWAMSALYSNGRTSSDSISYLELGGNIVVGGGFYRPDLLNGREEAWRAERALGYPILIAAVSRISGWSVFWSSKMVNILVIVSILITLWLMFGRWSPVYALVLLMATPLNIWSMTWSEVPYSLGLIWFAWALYKVDNDATWRWVVVALLAGWWIFAMRYVGVIACLPVLILLARDLRWRQWPKVRMWVALALGQLAVYLIIFGVNFTRTGFVGARRHVPLAGIDAERLRHFARAHLNELNIFFDQPSSLMVWLGALAAVVAIWVIVSSFWMGMAAKIVHHRSDIWKYFLLVGLSQQLFMSVWFFYLGQLDARLLGPGTFLLMLAGVGWYLGSGRAQVVSIVFFVAIGAAAWTVNVPLKLWYQQQATGGMTYEQAIGIIKQKYRAVPAGSVVFFGAPELRYLRLDVQVVYISPEDLLMSREEINERESVMDIMLQRACRYSRDRTYVVVDERSARENNDSEWIAWLQQKPPGELVLVDSCDLS